MQGTIAITDFGWYDFLRLRSDLREVNFWTPSSRRAFRSDALAPFLFKLKAPRNAICGFAYFAQYTRLPPWLAWECFGIGNGTPTLDEMRSRIRAIRERIGYEASGPGDIGCIVLVSPVFFPPDAWVPQPADWPVRSLTPVRYDLTRGEGLRVWSACQDQAGKSARSTSPAVVTAESVPRYGEPRWVAPRIGQGAFRVAVLDAYGRACAVTGEHSLPVLDAAHIQPFGDHGPHAVSNGILLRADLHRLFDTGYLTVTPEHRLEVSARLRADYQNGRSYYPLHGSQLRLPVDERSQPDPFFLRYHNERVYLG